jgi:probable phosphoglycerate mutase
VPSVPGLLIVRHGQSIWNAEGRWQGQADPPLSAEGETQARTAAERLASGPGGVTFDLVVSSDLGRAVRTADLMAAVLGIDADVLVEPGLREYDVGEWSGLTRAEIEAKWPGALEQWGRGTLAAPPGGEDRATLDARVVRAGRRVAAVAAERGAPRILAVAHGGVIRALARATGRRERPIGHLAGYTGTHDSGCLFPDEYVDLLDGRTGLASTDPDPQSL